MENFLNLLPQPPASNIYPDLPAIIYPPKQILYGSKQTNSNGQEVITLRWNSIREPPANFAAFQLAVCDMILEHPLFSPWLPYEVVLYNTPSVYLLVHKKLNRRCFFTVRVEDVYGRWGPFSDPICFDV